MHSNKRELREKKPRTHDAHPGAPGLVSAIFSLTRLPLSLAVSFTALVGSILETGGIGTASLWAFAGVLALSFGASALNQHDERREDAIMKRTKMRPLPSGLMSPKAALASAAVLIAAGLCVLFIFTTCVAALVGLFGIVWYNLVYTKLKKKTMYAVLAGAVVGALPPIIGWLGAGGGIFHPAILSFALFMFLWQVPHFLILTLVFEREYENAGFPTIASRYGEGRVRFLICACMVLTASCTLLFPLAEIIRGAPYYAALIVLDCLMIMATFGLLFWKRASIGFGCAAGLAYAYQGSVIILIVLSVMFPLSWLTSM
jgi:protoheme IX farnesyltransferase